MDLKKILGGIVPFIASALPGPFGAIAKTVLGGVFGIGADDKDLDQKVADAVVNATPEQMLALKTAEQAFQARMVEMGYANIEALDKLAKEDTANARQREIDMAKAGQRDWTPVWLAGAAVSGFLAVILLLLLTDIDKWGQTKVGIVTGTLGTLTTIVVMIFGYYFGSSSSSAAKNAVIQKMTNGK